MNSEKVKEIKKALKYCCGECDCDCPFYKNGKSYKECKSLLLFEALTLINYLERENESLQDLCNKTYEDLTKEIDRLVNYIKELEEGIAKSMLGCEFLPECTNEKLKQFAERLKESGEIKALLEMETMPKAFKHIHDEIVKSIDETLKEFMDDRPLP